MARAAQADGEIHGLIAHDALSAEFDPQGVEAGHRIGHRRDPACRYLDAIPFFDVMLNIPCCHASRVQSDDFLVEAREAPSTRDGRPSRRLGCARPVRSSDRPVSRPTIRLASGLGLSAARRAASGQCGIPLPYMPPSSDSVQPTHGIPYTLKAGTIRTVVMPRAVSNHR